MLFRATAMIRPLPAFFRLGSRLLLIFVAGVAGVGPARAQPDPADRAGLIDAIYPVMIAALDARQFGRARNICDQVITWEPQNPVHHYNLACIEAQAGGTRIPYALGALDLAAALGFDDVEHLQADPDLKPLRHEPRFAEIVRRMAHNAHADDAISALTIPPRRPIPAAAAPVEDPADQPAPPAFRSGAPVGLYWMSRYLPETRILEQSVWYFAPTGTVYRNLEYGYSAADLARHAGPQGTVAADDRTLHIQWQDGTTSSGPLERDRKGFAWDMAIFSAVAGFGQEDEVAGVYVGGGLDSTSGPAVVPPRLTLGADRTFLWAGVAIVSGAGSSPARLASTTDATRGRWELQGYSLSLTTESGLHIRRFSFPEDDERTVVKPDRLFFGGLMLKRQP